jgi:hypothetical protein
LPPPPPPASPSLDEARRKQGDIVKPRGRSMIFTKGKKKSRQQAYGELAKNFLHRGYKDSKSAFGGSSHEELSHKSPLLMQNLA